MLKNSQGTLIDLEKLREKFTCILNHINKCK